MIPSWIIVLLILHLDVLLGLWLITRAVRKHHQAHRLDSVCGCKHHAAFHTNGKGACHYVKFEGERVYRRSIGCGCQQYIGPIAIELEGP